MDTKFLLRKSTGDQSISAEAELRGLLQKGQCRGADFLYDFAAGKWGRVGDHPAVAALFADKPSQAPDRRVIYFLVPGAAANAPSGPFSTKEIQSRAQAHEICASTWVFVEGDKEWRQVRNVKILNDMLPPLPTDVPAQPAAAVPPPAVPPTSPTGVSAAPAFSLASQPDAPPPPPSPSALTLDLGSVAGVAAASVEAPPPPPAKTPQPGAVARAAHPAPHSPPASAPSAGGTPSRAPAIVASAPEAFRVAPRVAASASAFPEPEQPSMPSIALDLGSGANDMGTAPASSDEDPAVEREDVTMALDTMGLNLHSVNATPPPSPPKPQRPGLAPIPGQGGGPPAHPAPPSAGAEVKSSVGSNPAIPKPKDADGFDGIVAEIPMDPIWLVKQASGETVSGPFRFLEVMEFLEQGRLTKNDKIARTGTKAFVKIQQQYEFNVKYSIETVIENGQEKQKILIRRRHPRVPYITGVQIVSKHGLLAGQCVNISGGGILMEVPKTEFNLGDIIEVKVLPGLIPKSISCKALIIGKIPKIPPGYALKFEDLKPEDKEAIEYYVQETLKREMSKKT